MVLNCITKSAAERFISIVAFTLRVDDKIISIAGGQTILEFTFTQITDVYRRR